MKPIGLHPGDRLRQCRRRGIGLLLLVLSISILLVGTGLTLISIQRADRRLQQNVAQTDELDWCARSGIGMALTFIEQASTWRTLAAGNGGRLFTDFAVGDGKVTVQLFDDADGQLANSDADPVRVRSTAKRGTATCTLEGRLRPRPHPALGYACFGTTTTDMNLLGNCTIRGPVRSHGNIKAYFGDNVEDDASFETVIGYTIQNPLAPKSYVGTTIPAPQPSLAFYESMATIIYGDGGTRCDLLGCNLTPTVNTLGSPNSNGIYWLQAGGREVYIENLHLKGTLIITGTGNNAVTFRKGLVVEPGPLQYPVLLISCPNNDVMMFPESFLSELSLYLTLGSAADMNGDGDVLDQITSQVRGLVWSDSLHLNLGASSWYFTGCAINAGINVNSSVTIDNDLTLQDASCPGFMASGMDLVPGSVREVWP